MSTCFSIKHKTEPKCSTPMKEATTLCMLHSCSSMSSGFSPFPGILLEEAGWRGARSPPHITMQNAKQPREGDAAPPKDVGLGSPRQHKTWIFRLCDLSPLLEKFQCLEESGRSFVGKFPMGQATN